MTSLLGLFLLFFQVSLFGFGGGYAMLPLIYQGIQGLGLMSASEFARLVALSQITPGPIAINAATYVGFRFAGIPGAVVATFGSVLPSILLVLLVAHFMKRFKESRTLVGFLQGIRPATLGLLGAAAVFLAQGTLVIGSQPIPLAILICIVVMVLSAVKKIHPITLTILAGIAGAFTIR